MGCLCSIFTVAGHCAGKTRVSPASQHLDSLDARPGERDARQAHGPPQRRNDSMRQRVSASRCIRGWLLALAALLAAASLSAQTFVAPTLPATTEQVSIPASAADAASALTDAIRNLLTKGRTLESNGRWAEALTYYEEALREYPQDPGAAGSVRRGPAALQPRTTVRRPQLPRIGQDAPPAAGARSVRRSAGQDQRPLLHHAAVAGTCAARRSLDGYRPGRRKLPATSRRSRPRRAGDAAASRDRAAGRTSTRSNRRATLRSSLRRSPAWPISGSD